MKEGRREIVPGACNIEGGLRFYVVRSGWWRSHREMALLFDLELSADPRDCKRAKALPYLMTTRELRGISRPLKQ